MKNLIILFSIVLLSCAQKTKGKPLPRITGVTLKGKSIDSTFFKNKITFINFMYVGCPPCMVEVRTLNKIHRLYKDQDFQILCIAPHTPDQLRAFNSDDKNGYSDIRRYFKADVIQYEILPECEKEIPKEQRADGQMIVQPECDRISGLFKIDSYPRSFLIDRNGRIRKSYDGFLVRDSDSLNLEEIRTDIDSLLDYQ